MSRTRKTVILTLLMVVVVTLAFAAGCALAPRVATNPNLGIETVQQAWGVIFNDYVDRSKLDATAMSQAAIKSMVETLNDPYTAYLDAQSYHLTVSDFGGTFQGIGATVGMKEGKLVVIAPMPDSPAEKAGIKTGDAILAVDGKTTEGMSLTEAVLTIRGPKGTPVKLLILRQDETVPVELEIVRAEFTLTSVRHEMKDDIAYIRISDFNARTDEELAPVLEGLKDKGATGIILDLRHNPGGLLDAVIDVASHFVKEGPVVHVVDNRGNRTSSSVRTGVFATDLPMVVLVDEFSASGSEVLTGVVQDYGRATVAGKKTFGKGSVNILRQLKDGSGLYITTARWLTPNGRLIEGQGLEPDYQLDLEGEAALQWAIDFLKGKR
ncbi:MAG: PDZ domain-containing protein [Chloroflexi bacterium]|nr:PDZ domain-containing protein [Chloroflexota bacterium]